MGRRLSGCVRKGIAFHNAGLSNEQQRFVETNSEATSMHRGHPTLAAG